MKRRAAGVGLQVQRASPCAVALTPRPGSTAATAAGKPCAEFEASFAKVADRVAGPLGLVDGAADPGRPVSAALCGTEGPGRAGKAPGLGRSTQPGF